MKSYRARVSGVQELSGLAGVYEVTLDIPELFATYGPQVPPAKLYVGAEAVRRYKQLYVTEEWFQVTLPG
jgi:hypothetical protein